MVPEDITPKLRISFNCLLSRKTSVTFGGLPIRKLRNLLGIDSIQSVENYPGHALTFSSSRKVYKTKQGSATLLQVYNPIILSL